MASSTTKKTRASSKRARLDLFFVNGELHRRLHINRGRDMLTAWNYPKAQRVSLNYTDTLRLHQKAFKTRQVGEMLNRKRLALENAILRGDIPRPQYVYTLDEHRRMVAYYWREEDIMAAHDYFITVHRGRPRNDGLITPWNLPTPRELRAMIRDDQVLYVKQGDTFVPTFRAKDF